MYNVSPEYLEKLHSLTRVEHCRGNIGGVAFDDDNIISLRYSNQCSDSKDLQFGYAYIGQIEVEFINVNIPRGSWTDRVITIDVGMEIDNVGTIEWIPLGVFTVAAAEWGDIGVTVTANDNMYKLDKEFNMQLNEGSLYEIASFICRECGVTFGLTEEETEALPLGDGHYKLYPENDVTTYRDLISYLAAVVGGFATAARDGSIILKTFNYTGVVDEITADERIMGARFSDFVTNYKSVYIDFENTYDRTAWGNRGIESIILPGVNPFLQYPYNEQVYYERYLVLQAVAKSIKITPFEASLLSTIAYDIGDYITCSGGIAGEPRTCLINSIDYILKETVTFEGIGRDPRTKAGKTATEKMVTGLNSRTKDNEFSYYQYKNVDELELENEQSYIIADIMFASNIETNVEITLEVKLSIEAIIESVTQVPVYDSEETEIGYWTKTEKAPVNAIIRYLYDDVMINYFPVETMNEDGWHTLNYDYFIPGVAASSVHTFKAVLLLENGTGYIMPENVNLLLKGQGLVGDEYWDGTVKAEDNYNPLSIGTPTPGSIQENVPAITPAAIDHTLSASDNYTPVGIGAPELQQISEGNVNIIMTNLLFNIVTEDGLNNIVTEDGNENITTEDNTSG